jgi:hypothetical protein
MGGGGVESLKSCPRQIGFYFLSSFKLGDAMRSFFRSFLLHGSCSVVAALGVAASSADAGDLSPIVSSESVVGDLAIMNDLEPLAEIAAMTRNDLIAAPALSKSNVAPADTHLRTSVPSATRSRSLFVGGEVFANSAAVLPLLVGDMEPVASTVSRPMSGRLVGARPSLPLNRVPLTQVPRSKRTAK